MRKSIGKPSIELLKQQLESSRLTCSALAKQMDEAQSIAEKSRIAYLQNKALKELHALEYLLGSLERRTHKRHDETE